MKSFVNKLVLVTLIISFAACQESGDDKSPIDPNKLKREQEEQMTIGSKQNFFELGEENFAQVMMEFIEKPKDVLPLLIIKVTSECNTGGCVDYVKKANIVASIAKRQNRVALMNCIGPEGYMCEMLSHDEE